MDWNKLKFTRLDNEIMEFLFRNPTTIFMGKEIADKIKVSQTAIAKSIDRLSKVGLVNRKKKILLSISMNRDDKDLFDLKRVYNLKSIYSSGLINNLSRNFPGSTIVLFGSYSSGEDTEESDIDLAIIGYKEKKTDLIKFENKLQRKIQLHFLDDIEEINKNLRESIINGITLKGSIVILDNIEKLNKSLRGSIINDITLKGPRVI